MEVSLSLVLKGKRRVIRLLAQDASAIGIVLDETNLSFAVLKNC